MLNKISNKEWRPKKFRDPPPVSDHKSIELYPGQIRLYTIIETSFWVAPALPGQLYKRLPSPFKKNQYLCVCDIKYSEEGSHPNWKEDVRNKKAVLEEIIIATDHQGKLDGIAGSWWWADKVQSKIVHKDDLLLYLYLPYRSNIYAKLVAGIE